MTRSSTSSPTNEQDEMVDLVIAVKELELAAQEGLDNLLLDDFDPRTVPPAARKSAKMSASVSAEI